MRMIGWCICFSLLVLGLADAKNGPQHYNGHYYEFVSAKVTFAAAKANAAKKSFRGHKGHLLHLDSYYEARFVRYELQKLQGVSTSFPNTWIGSVSSLSNPKNLDSDFKYLQPFFFFHDAFS